MLPPHEMQQINKLGWARIEMEQAAASQFFSFFFFTFRLYFREEHFLSIAKN